MDMIIKETLKELIMKDAQKNIAAENITDNTLLIEDLEFDSISIMKLIVDIEERFSVEFSDQFLLLDNISRFETLADYIYRLKEQSNGQEII